MLKSILSALIFGLAIGSISFAGPVERERPQNACCGSEDGTEGGGGSGSLEDSEAAPAPAKPEKEKGGGGSGSGDELRFAAPDFNIQLCMGEVEVRAHLDSLMTEDDTVEALRECGAEVGLAKCVASKLVRGAAPNSARASCISL